MRIAVTDGIDVNAKKHLEEFGHTVSEKHYSNEELIGGCIGEYDICLLYTSPSPRDLSTSCMPSSA